MTAEWRPTASLAALRRRAELLAAIRAFFHRRGVLEVETPVLAASGVTEPAIEGFQVAARDGAGFWLQTSPEYAMKRLLAAGSGAIYQVARAFRSGEQGHAHNPEFTLVEWYRPGFDHHQLMQEVAALAALAMGPLPRETLTYAEAFRRAALPDPHLASLAELREAAVAAGLLGSGLYSAERDTLLDGLLGTVIAPSLGRDAATFLTDFPASQAALARVRPGVPPVAERFELFIAGQEIANGFHELTDPAEQRERFARDDASRGRYGQAHVALDEALLGALDAGVPPCSGVALGFDRLCMAMVGAQRIEEVMAFPSHRA